MEPKLSRNDVLDALYTITHALYDNVSSDPSSKAQANNELTNLIKNYCEDFPTTATIDSVMRQTDLKQPPQNLEVIKKLDIPLELMNILNYVEIDCPQFILSFSQSNENDFKLYSSSLHYVILLVFYSVFLSDELRNNREIVTLFQEGTPENEKMQWLMSINFRQFFEQGDKTAQSEINKSIIELGLFLISKKLNGNTTFRDKFKLLLDVINNKYLFLTDYDSIDHFMFIRLCIEAMFLSLNMYNLSLFIKRHSEENFKVRSIIINKTKKLATNYPFMVLQDKGAIKIIMCVLEAKPINNYNLGDKPFNKDGKNSGDYFSHEIDVTRDINVETDKAMKPQIPSLEASDNYRALNYNSRKIMPCKSPNNIGSKDNFQEPATKSDTDMSTDMNNQNRRPSLNVKMSPLNINVGKKVETNKKIGEELNNMSFKPQIVSAKSTSNANYNPPAPPKKYNIFDFNLSNNQPYFGEHKNPYTDLKDRRPDNPTSVAKIPHQNYNNENVANADNLDMMKGTPCIKSERNIIPNDVEKKPEFAGIYNIASAKTFQERMSYQEKTIDDPSSDNTDKLREDELFYQKPEPVDNKGYFEKNAFFHSRINDFLITSSSNTHALNFCVKFTHTPLQSQSGTHFAHITRTNTKTGLHSPDIVQYNRPIHRVHTYDVSGKMANIYRAENYNSEPHHRDFNNSNNRVVGVEEVYRDSRRHIPTQGVTNRYVIEHDRPPSVRRYVSRGNTVEKKG